MSFLQVDLYLNILPTADGSIQQNLLGRYKGSWAVHHSSVVFIRMWSK